MLIVYYRGNRNVFLEEEVEKLSRSFRGSLKSEFTFSDGNWSAKVDVPEPAEQNLKEHIQHVAKHISVEVTFGGYVQL